MANEAQQDLIFIKRVKKRPHGGHHGGQWKVAYADFVTAMMAFFLLLWLLNATTEEQKTAIADYFAPAAPSRTKSGAGGLLAGQAMSDEGARLSNTSTPRIILSIPVPERSEDSKKRKMTSEKPNSYTSDKEMEATQSSGAGQAARETEFANEHSPADFAGSSEAPGEVVERTAAAAEDQEFAEAEQTLRQALEDSPELRPFLDNVVIDRTPEGMRIQIVDKDGRDMFPSGSDQMYEHTRAILENITKVIAPLPNKISISGHTDAVPYRTDTGYGNWELSSDRANASRRAMIAAGLAENRIQTVVGKADTDPLVPQDPVAPSNRRISITLLRTTPVSSDVHGATAPLAPTLPALSAPTEPPPTPAEMLEQTLPYGG